MNKEKINIYNNYIILKELLEENIKIISNKVVDMKLCYCNLDFIIDTNLGRKLVRIPLITNGYDLDFNIEGFRFQYASLNKDDNKIIKCHKCYIQNKLGCILDIVISEKNIYFNKNDENMCLKDIELAIYELIEKLEV